MKVKRNIIFFIIVFFSILFLFYVYKFVLFPIIFSLFISYLFMPFANKLHKKKIPRVLISLVFVFILIAIIFIFLLKLLPLLYHEIISILNVAPVVLKEIYEKWDIFFKEYIDYIPYIKKQYLENFIKDIDLVAQISKYLQSFIFNIWIQAPVVLANIINIILIPVFTFFITKDWNIFEMKIVKLIPPRLKSPLKKLYEKINITLQAIIKGQLILTLNLSVLYIIGLYIIGIKFSFAIGAITGICRLVPYLDLFVGIILSSIVLTAYEGAVYEYIITFTFIFIIQTLDGVFFTPKVIGDKVGLHPLISICSVIAFGSLIGFWGVLLAIPIVAVLKDIISSLISYYLKSDLYKS